MSILVKGMDMPKSCLACDWCAHTIPADNYICYRLNRAVIGVAEEDVNETVNACCPIIPISPHGRLGDLDELYDHLTEWYLTNRDGLHPTEAMYIRAMLAGIKDAPTIIPAEWTET